MWIRCNYLCIILNTMLLHKHQCMYHRPSPRGGPQEKQLSRGTYRGVSTIIILCRCIPCRWGKWRRIGLWKPCTVPQGKQDFVKEIGKFQVVLHQYIIERPWHRRMQAHFLLVAERVTSGVLLCKSISTMLFLIFAASDITMEDNWLTVKIMWNITFTF